jgi:lipopolysaccharide biosynthesis glycosyltransferase
MSLPGNYDPSVAEQAFLNAFFQLRYLQLPIIYNANLALYATYPDLWKRMQSDFKIIHFTILKPFRGQADSAYSVPLKLYNDVWDEYKNSTVANQVKIKCV